MSFLAMFERVRDWLNNGGDINGARPWLFCNSNWLVRENMNDQARDNQGKLITNNNNQPALIHDFPAYTAMQEEMFEANGRQTIYPVRHQLCILGDHLRKEV
jgi:hypothetical protein